MMAIFFSAHDPCEPNPCWKGNCTNTTPGDFNCSCPLYAGGKRCMTSKPLFLSISLFSCNITVNDKYLVDLEA